MNCPNCTNQFKFTDETTLEQAEGCTMDCPNCSSVLIVNNGQVLDFHKFLHEKDSRWPADGKGTGFLEV